MKLETMSKALARRYYRDFELDPIMFVDPDKFHPYVYSDEKSDATVERHHQLGRVFLAVMLGEEPIGEVILKNIDREKQCCTLGIHMQNDSVKNKGYGTNAEILTLRYAFEELNLNTVYADALHQNKRSQHVLEKAGFRYTHQDETFMYYRCDKRSWTAPEMTVKHGGTSQCGEF